MNFRECIGNMVSFVKKISCIYILVTFHHVHSYECETTIPRHCHWHSDNSVKIWQSLAIRNPKPDLHIINEHTKFGENPFVFTQVIFRKWKTDWWMDVQSTWNHNNPPLLYICSQPWFSYFSAQIYHSNLLEDPLMSYCSWTHQI